MKTVPVGIALGSNLGDRTGNLNAGIEFLRILSTDKSVHESLRIETEPVNCPPGSARFLNSVAEIRVDPLTCPPRHLLRQLQGFEFQLGRPLARELNSPRPLDLDILYYGKLLLDDPELIIPHPRLAERRFVLEPLAHLRPTLILPGQTKTVHELLGVLG